MSIAACIRGKAEPEKILTIDAVQDYLPVSSWMTVGFCCLKGVEGQLQLFALVTSDLMGVTAGGILASYRERFSALAGRARHVDLSFQEQPWKVHPLSS